MRRRRLDSSWRSLRLAIGGALALGLSTTAALGAPSLPTSPTGVGVTAAHHGLAVKPATIIYTGDGTGLIGGASVRAGEKGIAWSSWTASTASGTGFDQVNECHPNCAAGTYHGYEVRIELWRPQRIAGELVFTRMTIFFVKHAAPGDPPHYTFTNLHVNGVDGGGFGWGPPDAAGYCVHTHGAPPVRGCKNIHALPAGSGSTG